MKKRIFSGLLAVVLGLSLVLVVFAEEDNENSNELGFGCTNILVGKDATVDGSTMGTYCCDGAGYSRAVVIDGKNFRHNTMTPIYYRPYPSSYAQAVLYSGTTYATLKGYIPQVDKTYRYVSLLVYYDKQSCGGMNEYGLTIGETTIGSRSGTRNPLGLLSAYTNYKESSLMALALQRAKTAREAIQVMGSLAETYGYAGYGGTYGEHISVTDGNEAWAFEVWGAPVAADWTPGCGIPGAVWCAERIPDGNVGVSANRSRIGAVPLAADDYFMFSSNIRSVALALGYWNGVEPFICYAAYAPSSSLSSSLREWRVLSLAAPSLGLAAPASSGDTRYPFSVPVDTQLSVQDVMAIHRDYYKGTPYDITANAKFKVPPSLMNVSPMASPFGPSDLYSLLGISNSRCIATSSSVFCYVSQVSQGLPDPIKGCLWYGSGPAEGTTFVPIYSGALKLPESWGETDMTSVNRDNTWWAFKMVDQLPLIKWQTAITNIRAVQSAAEATFFVQQPDLENSVLALYSSYHKAAADELARKLVTKYTNACMNAVSDGYWKLADYLLYKYFSGGSAQTVPVIDCPPVPTNLGPWRSWWDRAYEGHNDHERNISLRDSDWKSVFSN